MTRKNLFLTSVFPPEKNIRTMTFCVIYDVFKEKEMREFVSILVSQVVLKDIGIQIIFYQLSSQSEAPRNQEYLLKVENIYYLTRDFEQFLSKYL